MFSKTKMGMLMGTMAVVLSLGSIGGAMAADSAKPASLNKPAEVKFKTGKMGHHGGVGFKENFKENTELLSLLKLDADKLKEELAAGKTLAAIAQAQGVDTADVVALLVEQQEAKLKEAVAAGKLKQEQADKLSENLSDRVKEQVENTKPDKGFGKGGSGKGGFIGGFEKNEELLSLLKLDAAKFQEQLKADKSLAAIAEAQGVSVDDLVDLLVKQQETKLKEAVAAGKLTQEQADKMNENASQRVKEMVQNTHQGRGPGKGMGFEKNNEELLSLLKLDADKLKEEQKAGKSLATIAEAQGVSVDDLVALLVKQQKANLKEAVTAGKLTQEQADKMNENASERVKEMVQNTHQGRGPGKGMGFEKNNEELLSLLKLDADKLKEEQKAEKSLATIAKEQGVEVDDVIELLVGQREAKLKEEVKAGKLTQEQADKRSEELTAMVQKMVDGSFEKVVFPRHEKEGKDQEKTM
ncbi:hypothetical protein HPY27_25565 [Brevibacillus sp. HB1.1]|uniref:hypothetical protein n=1 Tax=Brevibacillus sp. HB1.1 TaxID=2738808 RepID=UPI001576F810|nr:hypothetical protein [Brevibacillus sp. HB1.1]NTU33531.1 hypothetical protein [Brevibacillus sp. HB1.1]